MVNLRELVESDLDVTLEGDFGLPVTLIDPDGETYTFKKDTTDQLMGQILYDTLSMDPETGEPLTSNNPIVSIRRSSLDRIPIPGETWIVKIPTTPSLTADLEDFITSPVKSRSGGASIGFIKLYLQRISQS